MYHVTLPELVEKQTAAAVMRKICRIALREEKRVLTLNTLHIRALMEYLQLRIAHWYSMV